MILALIPQFEQLPEASEHWCFTRDGDLYAYELFQRHYSAMRNGRRKIRQFVGPGKKLVLLSKTGNALFAWRHFIDDTQPIQRGHNCAVFRNEGNVLSSQLILEAVSIVFKRWGINRCYTFIDPAKIHSSNPGFCFKKAGWKQCGTSKNGKLILELIPEGWTDGDDGGLPDEQDDED